MDSPAFVLLPNGDRLRADTIQTIRQVEEDPGFGIPPRVVVDFQSGEGIRPPSCIVLGCKTVQDREDLAAGLWVAVVAGREAIANGLRAQRDELLAALKELAALMPVCGNDHDISVRVFQVPTGSVRKALAAIAKAEGRAE